MIQDLRLALRTWRRTPGTAAAAILSLAFGIGATTTMFSVVDALDFRPLPFKDADRLVWLAEVTPLDHEICSRCRFWAAAATMQGWAAGARSFESLGAVAPAGLTWVHDDASEPLKAAQTTAGFFGLLGVRTFLGREFVPDDTAPGAEPVVLLSYEFWRTRLDANVRVVGTRLPFRAGRSESPAVRPVTVIGVLPEHFRFRAATNVWTPLPLDAGSGRTSRELAVVGRLRSGLTIGAANAEIQAVSARLALVYPDAYRGWGASVAPLREFITLAAGEGRAVLLGLTTLVLVIAVMNVAALLIGRAVDRRRELALCRALGASGPRLVRQWLVEGSSLGVAGGIVGVLFACWGVRFVPRWFAMEAAGLDAGVDWRMLAFAAGVSVLAGCAVAVAPAIRAAAPDLSRALQGRTATAGVAGARASNTLITLQIALALVLLTAAGLLSRDFLELRYFDLGYDPSGLHSTSIAGTREQSSNRAAWGLIAETTRARVAAIPGVRSASLEHVSAIHPEVVRPEGTGTAAAVTPVVKAIDDDYFTTFGTRVLEGRAFGPTDRRGAPLVAIVNKAAAERFWPGQPPIGRRVVLSDSASGGEVLTVVGVAANAERFELAERHWPMIYRPFGQAPIYHAGGALHVRVVDNAAGVLSAAQAAIRQATGGPAAAFSSHEERLGTRLLDRRLNAVALDLFAGFGLLLAAMGVYSSVAYSVARRTREIGVRIALGAGRASVLGLVARRGLFVAIAGVAMGTAGALALTRVLRSFVLGTSVTNPWVFAGCGLLMIAATCLAILVPARRAIEVDPVAALRAD